MAGLTDDPGLSAIYEQHRPLFTDDVFAGVEPSAGEAADDRRRANLREFLAMGIEGYVTRSWQDAYLSAEAETVAEIDGRRVPYRELPVLIRREPERALRAVFDEARLEVVERRLNPILADALAATHEVAGRLLGTTYDAYCEELAGVDFDALEEQTSAVLDQTRDAYQDLLRYYARRMVPGVRLEELRTHDLLHMLHGPEFESLFPDEAMLARLSRPIAAMGLDLTAGGRIELDLEERPTKSPRAFCSAIRVPHEVKLVLRPHGGPDDYGTFLHELGHALHFAYVDPGQPVEFRLLGDNAVTEGYAITFDHLLHLAEFLRRVVEVVAPGEYLRFAAFRELALLRRYCAKFSYERSLHRHGASSARAAEYAERLTDATGVRASATLYLDDVDPHFYCIRYLRAWMLTGTLHAFLRERFDADWFLNPRTGPFLEELWAMGQAEPAEMLARERLGADRLGFEPLLAMVEERLG